MGGWKTTQRVLLAVVTVAALVAAVWLVVLGHQQANRAADLRRANAATIARNDRLASQLRALTTADAATRTRLDRIDGSGRDAVAELDDVIHAWNEWLDASNGLIGATNGWVDQARPAGAAVRADLDPRVRTVTAKEAAFVGAVRKFAAAAAKARAVAGSKP